MTIEEMKKALNSGKSADALLKEYEAQLKKAQNEVAAERVKADKLDNARRKLATTIANYAQELFGESDIDVAEIIVMLKGFEDDVSSPLSIFFKGSDNKKNWTKEKKNKIKFDKLTESDDDILEAFFELFK